MASKPPLATSSTSWARPAAPPTPTPTPLRARATPFALAVITLASLSGAACGQPGSTPAAAADSDNPNDDEAVEAGTELVVVARQDVTETKRANAFVGFGPVQKFPSFPGGRVTWAPEQNTVLSPGDVALMVDNKPIILASGKVPMFRELRQIPFFQKDRAGNPVGLQTGDDVKQLQAFLIGQGFDDDGLLAAEEAFGPSTDRALRAWQASVGHDPDGITNGTQIVFVEEDIRVDGALEVGQEFIEFSYTGTDIILTVDTPTTDAGFFAVDSIVEIRASDSPIEGTVIKSTRAFDPGRQAIRQTILIAVDAVGADSLGQSVDVVGTVVQAEDALSIPVRALLALSEGGWAVEVPAGDGETKLVAVELERVVETTAIISGLDEGTEIVVPT